MKKSIIVSVISITAIATGLTIAALAKGVQYQIVKATEKTFRFDSSSWIPGISGQTLTLGPGSTYHQAIVFTEYSGYSSGNAINCEAYLSNDTNQVDFCQDGYFMKFHNGSGKYYAAGYCPLVNYEIGINNLTSLKVKTKSSISAATITMGFRVFLYDEDGHELYDHSYYTESETTISVADLGITESVKKVHIWTSPNDAWIIQDDNTTDSYGIEYIEGTWSC